MAGDSMAVTPHTCYIHTPEQHAIFFRHTPRTASFGTKVDKYVL